MKADWRSKVEMFVEQRCVESPERFRPEGVAMMLTVKALGKVFWATALYRTPEVIRRDMCLTELTNQIMNRLPF